jgi:hypothetical protein
MIVENDISYLKKNDIFVDFCCRYGFKLILLKETKTITIYNSCFIIHLYKNSYDGAGFEIYNYKDFKKSDPLELTYKSIKFSKKYDILIEESKVEDWFILVILFINENFAGIFNCENFEKYSKYFRDFNPEWTVFKEWISLINNEERTKQNTNIVKKLIDKMK